MTDRYCVFGHPVSHSKSPMIHAAFAEQTGEELEYGAIEAPLDDFAGAWARFVAQQGRGANVTVPFKEDAFRLCDTLSDRARRAGAVNTLILESSDEARGARTRGDNTDGLGLIQDLAYYQVSLAGARVLLLGAGGAVRGVLEPLLQAKPKALFIANRTPEKAVQLAEDFCDMGEIAGGGYAEVEGRFDVVINGTSASLAGELPPLADDVFANGATAYDMLYGAEPSVFLRWAVGQDARPLDGLGMLVEQAAVSFQLWRGKRPETHMVRERLRQLLNEE